MLHSRSVRDLADIDGYKNVQILTEDEPQIILIVK